MSLLETINEDIKAAMRRRARVELKVLRLLKAALYHLYRFPDTASVPDWAVADAVEEMLRQHREAIEAFRVAGRDDLADDELKEMEVLLRYRPSEPKA